ncbi:MAG: hypothetical protein OES13_08505 [Acidimicrobiia bacterium]|nr:hypothetical protein [Acidimicrobiia bacterium]
MPLLAIVQAFATALTLVLVVVTVRVVDMLHLVEESPAEAEAAA